MPLSGSYNATYRAVRESSRVVEGNVPVTQSVNVVFDTEAYLEVEAAVSVPTTITIFGTHVEDFYFEPGDRAAAGETTFSSVDFVSSTLGATEGSLVVTLVDTSGVPIIFNRLLEERRGFFERRGVPVAYTNYGEVRLSEATLLKQGGVELFEEDQVYISTGETYTVVRSVEVKDYTGVALHQVDLKKTSKDPEPIIIAG